MTKPSLVIWVCETCGHHNPPTVTACVSTAGHPVQQGSVIKYGQTLPPEFAATLRSMKDTPARLHATLLAANSKGWNCEALAVPLDLSRERIRQIIKGTRPFVRTPEIPDPPRRAPVAKRQQIHLVPTPQVAEQLREMYEVAFTVSGGMSADHPARAVSVAYTALLQELIDQGVTVYRLARILGIHHTGIYMRLARHGYREPSPALAGQRYTGQQSERIRKPSRGGAR